MPFLVDSFFDVSVELSLDGGATWAGQPTPVRTSTWGAVKAFYR